MGYRETGDVGRAEARPSLIGPCAAARWQKLPRAWRGQEPGEPRRGLWRHQGGTCQQAHAARRRRSGGAGCTWVRVRARVRVRV